MNQIPEKRRILEIIVGGKIRRRLDLVVNGSVILLRRGKPPARFKMDYETFQKELYEVVGEKYPSRKVEIRDYPNQNSHSTS